MGGLGLGIGLGGVNRITNWGRVWAGGECATLSEKLKNHLVRRKVTCQK